MTVFTSIQESNSFISDNLLEFIETYLPRSAIIVESKNGEMFTHMSDNEIADTEKITDTANDDTSSKQINSFFIGLFFFMLIISVFIFIYVVRQSRINVK